jgi:thiamine biosynthesis lipoprotein
MFRPFRPVLSPVFSIIMALFKVTRLHSPTMQLKQLCLITCFLLCACHPPESNEIALSGMTMGTSYSVKFRKPAGEIDVGSLKKNIDRRLEDINKKMSTYLPDSELSIINRAGAGQWLPISDELYNVIQEALAISESSHGAFDITVGPLVNLWGFGPSGRPLHVPDEQTIKSTLEITGYHKIHLQDSPRAIRKDMDAIFLDLSGIAKGYAVDAVSALLEQVAVLDYMVEIGGEIRARGVNAEGESWRIGIEKPVTDERSVERVIHLKDTGMATSGNYRNFYDMNGVRYSHIINPATGKPVIQHLASVTVLDRKCMVADAWATALFVLGPDRGMALVQTLHMPVLFIGRTGTGFSERMTDEFKAYLVNDLPSSENQ